MSKISVVVNTFNEEKNLSRALSSVKDLADEIVVVDMKSDDDTVKIAKKFGAKVFFHERTWYVEPARNYAVSKATGEWILILDADEEVSKKLAVMLVKLSENGTADYYEVPRVNRIFGKWIRHSRWWPDYNVRFFKKGHVSWSKKIHEPPTTKGKGEKLLPIDSYAIIHHNYDSVEQYIDRLNRYTTIQAINLIKNGYKFTWVDLIKKPASEFIDRYFAGSGYNDGIHGLALAFLQSFSELVVYLKVWQDKKFLQDAISLSEVITKMKDVESEIHYWQADAMVKEGGGVIHKIKRKLKI